MAEQDRLPGARAGLGVLDEQVHLPVVDGLLLRRVTVVLVAGQRLGVGEAGGVEGVRVAGEQRADRAVRRDLGVQAVHRVGAALGVECGPVGVGRERVRPEVVVERHVLVEEHHHMLDRSGGRRPERPAARGARLGNGYRAGGVRRRVRAGHRGAHGEADTQHGGGGDGGVVPGFLVPDTDHGWAFAHVRPPGSAGGRACGPPRAPGPRRWCAYVRTQEQKLAQRDNTRTHST